MDVDLDHARCVARADEFLPPTSAAFGRPGKPRSHRLYRVTGPAATRKFKSKSQGMLVELRSTGCQTVVPPSTHTSGEPIAWDAAAATEPAPPEPATVDPAELLATVEALAAAVRVELGERAAPAADRLARASRTSPTSRSADPAVDFDEGGGGDGGGDKETPRSRRLARCVAAMLRMGLADHNDGSGRLFAACCRAVEHDLSDRDALAAVRAYAAERPFPAAWSDADVLARVRDAERRVERGVIRRAADAAGRARVLIGPDEHRVGDEAVAALAADPTLYQRGGALVRVVRDAAPDGPVRRPAGSATIGLLPQASLRERMTRHAEFTHFVRRGDAVEEVMTHPTQWLVGAVDARADWPGIRPLTGVSDVPVLRPDGTLWQTPGYDPATGVLYEPAGGGVPAVPDGVGLDDADAAVDALHDVVCDFSFESPDHWAAWLAGLLTPPARFAFDGPAPLFLIDANVRGAGKELLAQAVGEVVLGREMPVSSYAHDPEEMRKKVTAIAIAGDRVVHLDNLEGNFGNDVLDRALTATRWKDRVLGRSQEVDLPLIPVWYGTGNNVAVAADTARRVVHVRLDVLAERPEERAGFRHPDLVGHVRANRGRLLAAGLTVLAAYCNAGRPRQGLTPFGSFEGWSGLVREAVVWAGQPDPCATRTKLAESSDTTAEALGQLVVAWRAYDPAGQGVVAAELLARLYARDFAPRDEASAGMRAALENLVGSPPGRPPAPRQVGARLRHFRRQVVGG